MAGRRGNNEGSIFKRKDGTWCGIVSNGRNSEGKLKRQYCYGKTRQEVSEKIIQTQSEIKAGTFIEPSKVKFGEWLDTWLQNYMKPSLRPTTYSSYDQIIRTHIKPELSDYQLRELRPEHLQKLYNNKHQHGRLDGTGSLSPRYVRYIHVIIHSSLEQAIKNQLIVRNVSEATTLPRQAKKEIRIFTVEEQKKFIEAAENDSLGSALKLDLASGLRLGELLALRWSDINFNDSIIRVRSSLSRLRTFEKGIKTSELIFQEPKTKSGKRSIPIPASILEDLKEHKRVQDSEKASIGEAFCDNGLVFCTQLGSPIEPRNMMRKFYELVESAGIPHTNFHAARHTFASRALEAGIHPKVVSEMLGHASISITLDLYSHVLPDLKKEAASKLNHLFDNSTRIEDDEPEQKKPIKRSKALTKTKSRDLNMEI